MSDKKPQIQETERTTSRMNVKNTKPRHIIFKLQKIRDTENNPGRSQRKRTYLSYRRTRKDKNYFRFQKPRKEDE